MSAMVVRWDGRQLLVDVFSRSVVGWVEPDEVRRRAAVPPWNAWWVGRSLVITEDHWFASLDEAVEAMQRGWAAERRRLAATKETDR